MSNFLRKGRRKEQEVIRRVTKKHTKAFYKILGELDRVANEMKLHEEEVTKDNIVEVASNYTDIKIENLEKIVLMGKMGLYEH